MLLQNLKKARLGFTLIELAIVLSVVGTVTAGLWRISSNSNQQSKDQATAQQQTALINGIKAFLADQTGYSSGAACAFNAVTCPQWGGQAFLANMGIGNVATLAIPVNCPPLTVPPGVPMTDKTLCSYLPPGTTSTTQTPYGHTFKIQVKAGAVNAAQNYSFMISSIIGGGTSIPDADGGRISGLIGGEGGFNFSSPVCVSPNTTKVACGTMNTWSIADITTYGFAAQALDGFVISLSTPSTSTAGLNNQWLARSIQPGDDPRHPPGSNFIYNTMSTDIFMGPYDAATDTDPYPDPYATPPSAGTSIPSIHLHNGYIEGNGAWGDGGVPGGASVPQLSLHSDYSAFGAAPSSVVVLSNAPAGFDSVGVPTGAGTAAGQGCSALNNLGTFPTLCPPVMHIYYGDVSLSNGILAATKVYSVSDMRLKKDIHPIKNALSDLMKIDPVSFGFKQNRSHSMGVTAQDLEKVYPQLVLNNGDTKYVEYSGLIGPLISAVQELKHENDALKSQLDKQNARLQKLDGLKDNN